jgi:CBS domain-containing protein
VKDIETALLMMREHGIDQVLVVNADTATLDTANAVTITRAAVELDEDIAALVCAIIARHDPERLGAMAPVLVVSRAHVEEITAELLEAAERLADLAIRSDSRARSS